MNLLIDTHTLLWAIGASKKLSKKAHAALCDGGNSVFVSAVSFWETALNTVWGN
jgi:PIN domain nuclease of toxin-antitoxin system